MIKFYRFQKIKEIIDFQLNGNNIKERIASFLFYFSIFIFILAFGFRDTPPFGWYQQFMPNLNGRSIQDITFTDSLNGYAITNLSNDTSFILKTTSGGDNWYFSYIDTGLTQYYRIKFINQNTGFIGGYIHRNEIVKTTNSGINWFYINAPYDQIAYDLSILNEDTLWIVDGSNYFGGVFFTSDGGVSWTQQTCPPMGSIYMYNARIGFVSSGYGIYKTTNSGIDWNPLVSGKAFTDIFFIDSLKGWYVWDSVRMTTNGGMNWNTQILPSGQFIRGLYSTRFSHFSGDTIWMGGSYLVYPNNQARGILFHTTNEGNNWQFQVPDTTIHATTQYSYVQFIDKINGWANTGYIEIHTITGGDTVLYFGIQQKSNNIPKEYKLYQNYPNPFNPRTVIPYSLKKSAYVKLIAYDLLGKEELKMVDQKQEAGEYEVDFMGKFSASGIYFYRLEIMDEKNNILFTETKRMALVK